MMRIDPSPNDFPAQLNTYYIKQLEFKQIGLNVNFTSGELAIEASKWMVVMFEGA
jgi:hypothetical protein